MKRLESLLIDNKYIYKVFFFFLLILPFTVFAISNDYKDRVYETVNVEVEENKVNLYLFYGQECPHCEAEREWLEDIKDEYKDSLNVYEFEVWHNDDNSAMMKEVKSYFGATKESVPFTVIGDSYYFGYSDSISSMIEGSIKEYIGEENGKEIKLPLLGKVNIKDVSIPLVAVILGFIDGFNPCAMWILLFLISLLFGIKNKKKAWILGITFLFVSALVYFLSMLGINLVLGIATINWMKIAIAIFILIAGVLNLRKYFKIKNEEAGCTVVDSKKRKKLITRMKKIIDSKSFVLAMLGIVVLAASVNLIELACSLGFPVIFTEILTLNNIGGVTKILYLLLYILFYMIDDLFVFSVSMITLEATGITNKYNKLCTLISAIIMIAMGLLMIFKPEWLMLNF